MKRLTVVQAPDIPLVEVKALEKHWKEALRDPEYTVITNYDVRVDILEIEPNCILLITAPGLPPSEIITLKKKIDKEKNRRKGLVVVNYEVRVDQIPPETK